MKDNAYITYTAIITVSSVPAQLVWGVQEGLGASGEARMARSGSFRKLGWPGLGASGS